jgi:hypothetical protein
MNDNQGTNNVSDNNTVYPDNANNAPLLDIAAAMQMADLVRRHVFIAQQQQQQQQGKSSTSSSTLNIDDTFTDTTQPSTSTTILDVWEAPPILGLFNGLQAIPPGMMEGIAATTATLGLTWTLRSRLIKWAGGSLLPDLVVNTAYLYGGAMVGLTMGSLIGSHVYLDQLAQRRYRESATADAICSDDLVQGLLQTTETSGGMADTTTSSSSSNVDRNFLLDPQAATMKAFHRALQTCRDRREQSM